jgi:hypothetical protein
MNTRFYDLTALAVTSAMVALGPIASARADEPLFGYTYTTDLLPQGKWEIEQWATDRISKAHGAFNLLENRTELSYGVTDRFQLSLYANYAWTRADHDNADGTTSPPETFAGPLFDSSSIFKGSKFVGVSAEGVYRVMSPYTDPFGIALYFEPTFGNGLASSRRRRSSRRTSSTTAWFWRSTSPWHRNCAGWTAIRQPIRPAPISRPTGTTRPMSTSRSARRIASWTTGRSAWNS